MRSVASHPCQPALPSVSSSLNAVNQLLTHARSSSATKVSQTIGKLCKVLPAAMRMLQRFIASKFCSHLQSCNTRGPAAVLNKCPFTSNVAAGALPTCFLNCVCRSYQATDSAFQHPFQAPPCGAPASANPPGL